MKRRHLLSMLDRNLVVVGLAVCLVALAWPAAGEEPSAGARGGGLLPAREQPSLSGGRSREELLRQFDLDSDGKIDTGEAEIARTRMRRNRNEAVRNSGVDPLTGRTRGAAADVVREPPPADEDTLVFPGTTEDAPPPRKPAAKKEESAPKPAPTGPPGRMPAMTGGVRAGSPAVRPGYGAPGAKMDLNAGRPREPRAPVGGATPRAGTQPPGRPLPTTQSPRAPAQRPQLYPPTSPRPTAEDFGR